MLSSVCGILNLRCCGTSKGFLPGNWKEIKEIGTQEKDLDLVSSIQRPQSLAEITQERARVEPQGTLAEDRPPERREKRDRKSVV